MQYPFVAQRCPFLATALICNPFQKKEAMGRKTGSFQKRESRPANLREL